MRAQPTQSVIASRSRAIDGGMNVRKNTKRYGAVLGVVIGAVAIERVPLHRILGCAVEVDGRDGDRLAGRPTTTGRRIRARRLRRVRNVRRDPRDRRERATAVDWNNTQARNAVRAVKTNGHDALHYIDDLVDSTTARINAGLAGEGHRAGREAARPRASTNFNPDGDTGEEPRGRPQRRRAARTVRTARSTQRPTPRSRRVWSTAACRRTPSRSSAPSASERRAGTSTASRPVTKPMSTRRAIAIQALVAAGVPGDRRRSAGRARVPRRPPARRRRVGVVRQRRPELDVHRDLRDHCGRLRSDIAVLAQHRAARTHRAAVHVAARLVAVAAERVPTRPMRAASTARATRSVSARSRRASRSRRSGGDGYPVSPLEPQACP